MFPIDQRSSPTRSVVPSWRRWLRLNPGLLAERLIEFVPYMEKVYFANSGSEAVDTALKIARAYARYVLMALSAVAFGLFQ